METANCIRSDIATLVELSCNSAQRDDGKVFIGVEWFPSIIAFDSNSWDGKILQE